MVGIRHQRPIGSPVLKKYTTAWRIEMYLPRASITDDSSPNDGVLAHVVLKICSLRCTFSGHCDVVFYRHGAGPFTFFAPTDAAFAKLSKGTVHDLLKPENMAKLASIFFNHEGSGKVLAKDAKTGPVKTVEGSSAALKAAASGVTINNAKVVTADVLASHGVLCPGTPSF